MRKQARYLSSFNERICASIFATPRHRLHIMKADIAAPISHQRPQRRTTMLCEFTAHDPSSTLSGSPALRRLSCNEIAGVPYCHTRAIILPPNVAGDCTPLHASSLTAQECVNFLALVYGSCIATPSVVADDQDLCAPLHPNHITTSILELGMNRLVQVTSALAGSFEFLLATSLLALFASAYPDRYRTRLWRDGGSKGWNSDPSYRTYLYANYREIPPMPLIWDEV